MRIRKLAVELGVEPGAIIGILQEMGKGQFHDAEQQLGDELVMLIKGAMRQRPAARIQSGTGVIPRSDFLPKQRAGQIGRVEEAAVMEALKGVVPIRGKAAPKESVKAAVPGKAAVPVKVAVRVAVPVAVAAPKTAQAAPVTAHTSAPVKTGTLIGASLDRQHAAETELRALQQQVAALQEQNERLSARNREMTEDQSMIGAQLARHLTTAETLRRKNEGLQAQLDAMTAERDGIRARLDGITDRPGPTPLLRLIEQRGLKGADEVAAALRALLDARRDRDLLPRLLVEDIPFVRTFLHENLFLHAEGDDVPPNVVPFRVPADRSESEPPSAIATAARRFNSACLIRNRKNIVIVGGSPAYHRQLRSSVDERIQLRLISGTHKGRASDLSADLRADLVFVWASTILDHAVSGQFPEAVILPHRGIARMLNAAAERIEQE